MSAHRKPLGMAGKTLDKAIAAQAAGNRALAAGLFESVLRSRPDCVDALYLLGTLRAEARELAGAQVLLARAAQLQPDSPFIHNNLGNVFLLQGQLEDAARAFARALELRPDLVEAEVNLGILLRRLGRPAESEQRLRSARDRRPLWPQIGVNLALALADQERSGEAVIELQRVLEFQPDYLAAHEMLGLQLERLGRRDEAIVHLQRFAALAGPTQRDSEAQLLLARLGLSVRPERYPERPLLRTYERKAAHWDDDVARPGNEFLGPQHVRAFVERCCAGQHDLAVADLGCGTGLCGDSLRPLARRLVGVDLSPPMLAQAAAKHCYDELHCADLLGFLEAHPAGFDLLVASGVLILFGDLGPVLAAMRAALRPGGRAMFTTYRCDEGDIGVRFNLHFSHSADYLRRSGAAAGLEVDSIDEAPHEFEAGLAQPGLVAVLRRPAVAP